MAYAKSKTKEKKSKKSQGRKPRVNVIHPPKDMSLEDWQKALRQQVLEKEYFDIEPPENPGEPFVVKSPRSGRSYDVYYHGARNEFNRCECMDFKTSQLGTCKHLEAVKAAIADGRMKRKVFPPSVGSRVYVDYPAGRKVKIKIGGPDPQAMKAAAAKLFNATGELTNLHCDPSDFIRQATKVDPDFKWESDALNLIIEQRDKARRRKLIETKYKDSYFDGLLKTALHPYQAEGVRFAFTEGRSINADEMGLGKTVQAIATAELLRREGLISSVIIICPTSLKYQWLAEIKRFTGTPALVVEGDLIKRREQLANADYFYKICSFHAMSNTIKGGTIPVADMIIYDELQRLKNKETQMGKQLRKLESQYVLALSGTPLENKLDELYSVTQLVDQFILGPYYKFTADTTLTDDTGKIIGYKNLHEIARRLEHTMIRRKKADVKLQMPARTDTILYVPMTKEQREIHDEYKATVANIIHKWRRFKYLSEADRKRLLLLLSMMRMVCDSTYIIDQKSRYDTKIGEIMAIVDNLLDQPEGKVVIFSQWERMLRLVANGLAEAGTDFCFLHGGVPSPKRKDLIDRFRDDPDCRIFLSTDAGATGLNLQSASLLINVDLPWNPAVLEQRIARIYRLGQANPVQIINMVAKETIEERMLDTLSFKSNLAAGILDGGEDAVFVENSKFDEIVETLEGVINPSEAEETEPMATPITPEDALSEPKQEPAKPVASPKAPMPEGSVPAPTQRTGELASASSQPASSEPQQKAPSRSQASSAGEMRDLVAAGMSALGKIADALRNPESAAALADALVKEDPDTGQVTLNIPVPDKSTVVNILSAFSVFLGR